MRLQFELSLGRRTVGLIDGEGELNLLRQLTGNIDILSVTSSSDLHSSRHPSSNPLGLVYSIKRLRH